MSYAIVTSVNTATDISKENNAHIVQKYNVAEGE